MASDIPPLLLSKLTAARNNLRAIAYLSVMGGVFTLVFMLLMAYQLGNAFLNITYISFLSGGAVAFALGLGLLSFSDAARAAGSMWFLAWGILMIVVGFFSAWSGEMLMGVFCLVSGVIQLVFSDLLHLPGEVFITGYCGGDLEPRRIEEGMMKAYSDQKHPRLRQFLAKYDRPFVEEPSTDNVSP